MADGSANDAAAMRSADAEAEDAAETAPPRLMSWRRQIFWSIAVLALGAFAFGPGRPAVDRGLEALGLQTPPAEEEPKRKRRRAAPPVVLAEATAARDDLRLELTGGAVAIRSAVLKPRAAGRVTKVHFDAGDRLAAGDPALSLDDRRERLALERAQASLEEAIRRRDRAQRLRRSGSGSEAAQDAAETEAAIARVTRDETQEALDDRTVVAPFDGVVSLPLVELGDRIDTDDTIASFDDRSSLLVEVDAPETAFGRLALGMPVVATTAAFAGERFEGRLAEIDSRIDSDARTVTIRAEIPNPDDRLRPGMSFTLRLDLKGQDAVAVPELALQWERAGAFVWRIRDGRSERVPVRLVSREDGAALLRDVEGAHDPLSPGDPVAIEGVQRLKDGRRVRVLGDEEVLGDEDEVSGDEDEPAQALRP